jgi:hypothetical protein
VVAPEAPADDAPGDDGLTDLSDVELTDPGFDLDTGAQPCRGAVWPVDGAATADPYSPILVQAAALIAPVDLALRGPDGLVDAATVPYGDTLALVPAAPLAPETAYTLEVSSGCGSFSSGFSTNDVGPAVADPLDAGTARLDLSAGQWVRPVGVDLIVTTILDDLHVQVIDGDPLTIRAAPAFAGGDQTCAQTWDLKASTWANPRFELDLARTTLPTIFGALPIVAGTLGGAIRPDGALSGVHLRAEIDERDPTVREAIGFDDVCAVLGGFGAACSPCADGERSCAVIEAYDVPAVAAALDLAAPCP